jgi:hypothetical protein
MSLLDKLDRKFHKFAIKELMLHIVILNMAVFLMDLFVPRVTELLYLNPDLVMKGEVWRLITYVFIPPLLGKSSIIWIIFVLSLYYTIGMALEHEWGSFKFNVYYFVGMAGTTVASFIVSRFFGGYIATTTYLNLSLFLAFARIYPNYEILIFFFIPVKVKYLAILDWIFMGISLLLPIAPILTKVAIIVSILNYFLFFGKDILLNSKNRGNVMYRKTKYKMSMPPKKASFHKCTVCGITEKDNQQMEFRYCLSCEGSFEYCMDHLKNHEHIKKEETN